MANDIMRCEYRVLTASETADIELLKDRGTQFIELCGALGEGREIEIAKTKIEEAVMWAVKGITR